MKVESISLSEVAADLHQLAVFADTPVEGLFGVDQVERVREGGAVLVQPGEARLSYWLVLSGNIHAERPEPDGSLSDGGDGAPGRRIRRSAAADGQDQSRRSWFAP